MSNTNEFANNLDNEKIKKIFLEILKIEKRFIKTRTITHDNVAKEISVVIQKIVDE